MVNNPLQTTRSILPLVLLLTLAGCGNSNHTSRCQQPCHVGSGPEFLFATSDTGQILSMNIAPNGAPGPASSTPGPALSLGMAALGYQFLYVSDFQNAAINGYSINPSNGALVPLAGSPFSTGAFSLPTGLATTQAGSFLYATDVIRIDAFAINATTGIPGSVPGSPFPTSSSIQAAVDPAGKFLFATDEDPSGGVLSFTINPAT